MSDAQSRKSMRRVLTLPIKNAESLRCTVLYYRLGHGRLEIQVDRGQSWRGRTVFYLIFRAVPYFEGPLRWGGADLRVGTEDELKEVLLKYLPAKHIADYLEGDFRLYTFETDYAPVKIVAHKTVFKDKEPPVDYPLVS